MVYETHIGWNQAVRLARQLAGSLQHWAEKSNPTPREILVYPIPRGGNYVAALLMGDQNIIASLGAHEDDWFFTPTSDPSEAEFAIDDIIDSGETASRMRTQHNLDTFALMTKQHCDEWVVFPWEGDRELDAEDTVRRMIQQIGDDPTREGLAETPARVVKSWRELYAGYQDDSNGDTLEMLKSFEVDPHISQGWLTVHDIPFVSTCEHHMLPFTGTVRISYLPSPGKLLGLSKLPRVVQRMSRRLQLQERMTAEIGTALLESDSVQAVTVQTSATHHCVSARGVRAHGSTTEYTWTSEPMEANP